MKMSQAYDEGRVLNLNEESIHTPSDCALKRSPRRHNDFTVHT